MPNRRSTGIPYFETSAKEAINVENAFITIARNALLQIVEVQSPQDGASPIKIDRSQVEEETEDSGCC